MYYVYFAKSLKNNKYYVGFTSKQPLDRITEHNKGCNAWSKINRPLILIYFEPYYCITDAKAREKFYKSGFGKKIKKILMDSLSNNGGYSSVG